MDLSTAVGSTPYQGDPYDEVGRRTDQLLSDGPDEELEQSLPTLRYEAARRLAGQPGRDHWPPDLADPFPQVRGQFPEIGPDEVTTPTLAGGMLHHGGVIIRGLVGEPELDRLRAGMESTFAAREEAGGDSAGRAPWFVPFRSGGNTVGQRGKVHLVRLVDSPRYLVEVLDLYGRLGLLDVIESYFGEPPVFTSNKTVLRRLELPKFVPSDFHQDGQFMGSDVRSANVWLTLDDCGPDASAPALDVVPRREPAILPTGNAPSGFDWTLSAEEVEAAAGGTPPVRLDMKAGDALFFDLFLIHRTGFSAGMTDIRRAIEFWFFAPSSMPAKYQALRA